MYLQSTDTKNGRQGADPIVAIVIVVILRHDPFPQRACPLVEKGRFVLLKR